MKVSEIKTRILFLRRFCFIHRYLYYVKASPIVEDTFYDKLEKELKGLVKEYPGLAAKTKYDAICPTKAVGSSIEEDYIRDVPELVAVAESLLKNFDKYDKEFKEYKNESNFSD